MSHRHLAMAEAGLISHAEAYELMQRKPQHPITAAALRVQAVVEGPPPKPRQPAGKKIDVRSRILTLHQVSDLVGLSDPYALVQTPRPTLVCTEGQVVLWVRQLAAIVRTPRPLASALDVELDVQPPLPTDWAWVWS